MTKTDRFKLVDTTKLNSDEIVRKNISYFKDAWRRLKKNKVAMTAMGFIIAITIMAIIGPYLSGQDDITIVAANKNIAPNSTYWFGTDGVGRDIFTRLWKGTRVSLMIAVTATAVQVIVGAIYGGIMAYFGGIIDEVMMRIVEVLNSIPSLIFSLIMIVVLGNGYIPLITALCITAWTGTARMVRGQILKLRESEYVLAAEALGASPFRVIMKHLLPNTISFIIYDVATTVPSIIFSETILSFLGIGLQPPDYSLGSLLSTGEEAMMFYPYQLIVPSIVLCILMLAFNIFGDGVRDALDPQLRD